MAHDLDIYLKLWSDMVITFKKVVIFYVVYYMILMSVSGYVLKL